MSPRGAGGRKAARRFPRKAPAVRRGLLAAAGGRVRLRRVKGASRPKAARP